MCDVQDVAIKHIAPCAQNEEEENIMGALDEIGQDFMNTLLAIAALVGGVGVFLLFSISIWLLVLAIVVIGGGFLFWKMRS